MDLNEKLLAISILKQGLENVAITSPSKKQIFNDS